MASKSVAMAFALDLGSWRKLKTQAVLVAPSLSCQRQTFVAENRGALCASPALQWTVRTPRHCRLCKAESHPLSCRDVLSLPAARPKCWVSNHHIEFTNNASGVVLPNLLAFHSTYSSFVKFLALLGRLPSNFAFPSKACLDEWNSQSFTIDRGYCLSLNCLSRYRQWPELTVLDLLLPFSLTRVNIFESFRRKFSNHFYVMSLA